MYGNHEEKIADVVKSMSEDMNDIKTSLAQEATKLETAIEAKLVDSVGKEEVFSCVSELREVVGISNEANKAVEKKVILIAEKLETEKRKNILIFFGIKENGTMSDKDTVDEILREGLKFDSSRDVEEVSRVGRFFSDKIRPIRVKLVGIESKKEILQSKISEFR